MPITLPKNPKGDDYEDQIGAYLIALGYFIETNLHLREGTVDILEVDHIATPTVAPLTNTLLLDAKSGKSGFADIFKMYGWMRYLGIGKGCVVRTEAPDAAKLEVMEKIKTATNIHVATVDLTSSTFDLACLEDAALEMPSPVKSSLISAAWFGRIGQRKCLRAFMDFAKGKGAGVGEVKAATDYRWAIDQAFLARTPTDRASLLYHAYMASPNVTEALVKHLAGGNADKEKAEWKKVRDSSERPALQYSLMMENSARLGIVKNALLYVLDQKTNPTAESTPDTIDWSAFFVHAMPNSFKEGLAELKDHPHCTKIPRLFQVFIEVFGGFYRLGDDFDLNHLSEATGIPTDEVVPCLEMFDSFFPIPNGWFVRAKDELCMMKMVPAMFRGTGAFLRHKLHDGVGYQELYPQMGWLIAKWHNALYHILEPHLQVPSA